MWNSSGVTDPGAAWLCWPCSGGSATELGCEGTRLMGREAFARLRQLLLDLHIFKQKLEIWIFMWNLLVLNVGNQFRFLIFFLKLWA